MKVLITGGGCEEKIDNVRSVCNFSSGKTAAFIAEYLSNSGFEVTALMGKRSFKPSVKNFMPKVKTFYDFESLQKLLSSECNSCNYDAVIHAAAVSDYSPETIIVDGKSYKVGKIRKIPSGYDFSIRMKKNPKLVGCIKKWCRSPCVLIVFKLTDGASVEERLNAVKKVFIGNNNKANDEENDCDFVVSNDLSEITEHYHPCTIYKSDLSIYDTCTTVNGLATIIKRILLDRKSGGEKNDFNFRCR